MAKDSAAIHRRRRRHRNREPGDGATDGRHGEFRRPLIALWALAIVAPHLLGGTFAWGTAMLCAGAVACAGLAYREAPSDASFPDPMGLLLACIPVITVFYAIPLPVEVTSWVAPLAAENARATAVGLQADPPEWVALGLAPGAIWERLLFGIAVLCAYCGAKIVSTGSKRSSPLLVSVAVSGLSVSLGHLGHALVGATRVYGMYLPRYTVARGPLLNPNHVAGFMSLAVPICLGLAVQRRGAERWSWFVAAGVLTATALLAGSRGGTLVLLGGPLLFGTLYASRNKHHTRGGNVWFVSALVLCIAAAGFGLALVAREDFLDTNYEDLSKLDGFQAQIERLTHDVHLALLGAGRGGFRTAHAYFRAGARPLYSECLPLQYAMELGVPVASALLAVSAWLITRGLLRFRSPIQLGGLVGVVALVVQNLADFSLEMSGIAIPAAICLGAALPAQLAQEPSTPPWYSLYQVTRASAWLGALAVFFSWQAAVENDLLAAERRLEGTVTEQARGDVFWREMRRLLPRYPGDATLASLTAQRKAIEHARNAGYWLNRTFKLAPTWGVPHLWAAYWVTGFDDWKVAKHEFRRALELEPVRALAEVCPWVRTKPSAKFVLSIAPSTGRVRIDTLDRGAVCLEALAKYDEAEKLNLAILKTSPSELGAGVRIARQRLRERDFGSALTAAERVLSRAPNAASALTLKVDALVGLGKKAEARVFAEEALERADDPLAMLYTVAMAQAHAGDGEAARGSAAQFRIRGSSSPEALAAAAMLLSHCESILGNDARAMKAALEAHELTQQPSALATAATFAGKLGQTGFALRAWTELCAANPANKSFCDARDQLKKAIDAAAERAIVAE